MPHITLSVRTRATPAAPTPSPRPAYRTPPTPAHSAPRAYAGPKPLTMSPARKLLLLLGALFFGDSFLPWYRVEGVTFGSISVNGWESPGATWSIFAVLVGTSLGLTAMRPINPPWWRVTGPIVIGGLLIGKYAEESSYLSIGFYGACALTLAMLIVTLFVAQERS